VTEGQRKVGSEKIRVLGLNKMRKPEPKHVQAEKKKQISDGEKNGREHNICMREKVRSSLTESIESENKEIEDNVETLEVKKEN